MYYFPYVYAKKEERIALCTSISPEKTIPIIHGQEGDIPKLCKELVEKNARFVVVTENFAAIIEVRNSSKETLEELRNRPLALKVGR